MGSAYVVNLLIGVTNIIKLYNPNGVVKTLLTKTKIFIDTLSLLVRNMSNGYAPLDETLLKDILRQIAVNKRNNGEVADWALDELFRLATSTEPNIWRQLEDLEQRIINENNRINTSAEEKALVENYKTKLYPKISKLAYENEKYAIVVPFELSDLRTEGCKLHHCVGSYVSSVGTGQTTIVFLRQKEDIDTPFMTCEIYQNSIRQIHGLMNNNIKDQKDPDGINSFITEWCEINKISHLNNADRVLAAAVR
jgi:DNA polymerase III psi subunit